MNKRKSNINILVRATAIIVAVLLVFYFVFTLNNMSGIAQRVEQRKDGAYPVSVAAGHIETKLERSISVMQMILAYEPDAATADANDAGTARNIPDFDVSAVENIQRQNNRDIVRQLAILQSDYFADEENINDLLNTYGEITTQLNRAFSMWDNDPSNLGRVQEHIRANVIPLLEHAVEVDNAILDSTSRDIDKLYETVLEGIQQAILLSLVLIVAIFVAIFIYISLLSRKEEYEQELSDHLKDALTLAQNANMAKSSFLSNMSHDIRTPLNAIIGLSAIAEDNINDPVKMRQCLTQINTSSHHLLELINDVLDVNRIESGKTILAEDVFSLPDLVTELATISQPQIKEKHLDAEFLLKDIKHEYLIGDPIRIRQIMLNLTSNAIKYTDPGDSVTVSFEEYKSTRKDHANLRITVADTGMGMEPQFLDHIFEPFERERNERTDFIEGTGLGMAITKNLVTMMGGTIRVDSTLGEGTTFTVEVAFRIPQQVPKLDTGQLKDLRILAVGDDITSLDTVVSFLDDFSMDVHKLAIVPEEMDLASERLVREAADFDVIFVELRNASDEDAVAIDKVLDGIVIDNSVILVRAAETWQPIEHTEDNRGITAYIQQPIFRSRLYETLREALEIMKVDAKATEKTEKGTTMGSADNAHAEEKVSRVLIVEDNELNMDIASQLVKKNGPTVEQAFNGQEAVDLIKEKPEGYYDLIFMDWQMPVMDGIEATRQIIAYFDEMGYEHTPIVAMTANAFNDNRREAMAAGMDGFMAKPINVKELKETLSKYCS